MSIQRIIYNPTDWTARIIARSEDSFLPRRIAARAVYVVVSEALALVAAFHNAYSVALKALPAAVKLTIWLIPIAKISKLSEYIPEWAAVGSVTNDHIKPFIGSFEFMFCAPIEALAYSHIELGKELRRAANELFVQPPTLPERLWTAVSTGTGLKVAQVAGLIAYFGLLYFILTTARSKPNESNR